MLFTTCTLQQRQHDGTVIGALYTVQQ